jgi:hypothetical protein
MLSAIKEAKEKKSADSQKQKDDLKEKRKDSDFEKNINEPNKKSNHFYFQNEVPFPSLTKLQEEEKESLELEIEKIKKADFNNPVKEVEKKDLAKKEAELERLLKEIKDKNPRQNDSQLPSPTEKTKSSHKSKITYTSPLVLVCGVVGGVGIIILFVFLISKRKKNN